MWARKLLIIYRYDIFQLEVKQIAENYLEFSSWKLKSKIKQIFTALAKILDFNYIYYKNS